MIVSIIAAIGNNRVVGINNKIPWHLPADFAYFRKLTMGKPIIMGQKTYESIGRPLEGRQNIVITLDQDFKVAGCVVVHSIDESLAVAEKGGAEEAMIIGGVSIYSQFLPLADRMYLTEIEGDFQGDAFFPEFNLGDWQEVGRIKNEPDENNHYRYDFITLDRKTNEAK